MIRRRTAIIGVGAAMAGCLGDGDQDADDDDGIDRTGPRVNGRELDSAFPLVLEEDGEKVADVHYHPGGNAHWHRQPLDLVVDQPRSLVATVYDATVDPIPLGDQYHLAFDPPSEPDAQRLSVEVDGQNVTITATEVGEAHLRLRLHGPVEDPWVTPEMRTEAIQAEHDP